VRKVCSLSAPSQLQNYALRKGVAERGKCKDVGKKISRGLTEKRPNKTEKKALLQIKLFPGGRVKRQQKKDRKWQKRSKNCKKVRKNLLLLYLQFCTLNENPGDAVEKSQLRQEEREGKAVQSSRLNATQNMSLRQGHGPCLPLAAEAHDSRVGD